MFRAIVLVLLVVRAECANSAARSWQSANPGVKSCFARWNLANLTADRIEVTRDEQNKKWLVRIWVGDEVIRRHCDAPPDTSHDKLRDAAIKTANDEGYTVAPGNVIFP